MASLGTRTFWKPFDASPGNAADDQILKNSGYISIGLHTASYVSRGDLWQRTFGGHDDIALTTTVTYKSGATTIEAKAVQDRRRVRANQVHLLGAQRLIALKVPATADGLELKVSLTAVKDDRLQAGLDLLGSEEFQLPLQLAPLAVGEIVAIASMVKKVFADSDDSDELHASYAGIISRDPVADPVARERLTQGYLILVDNSDENSRFFDRLDPDELVVRADGLRYGGRPVELTYVVYAVTFDTFRGVQESATWNRKYQAAVGKLDDLYTADDEAERKAVWDDALRLWIEASALLFDDVMYTQKEKEDIKFTAYQKLKERRRQLSAEEPRLLAAVDPVVVSELRSALALDTSGADELADADVLSAAESRADAYLAELGRGGMAVSF